MLGRDGITSWGGGSRAKSQGTERLARPDRARKAAGSGRSTARKRLLNRCQSFVLSGKPERVFARDHFLSNPHGELAPPAFYELGIGAGFLLDECRHTGGARKIISDLAISDADTLHGSPPVQRTPVTC